MNGSKSNLNQVWTKVGGGRAFGDLSLKLLLDCMLRNIYLSYSSSFYQNPVRSRVVSMSSSVQKSQFQVLMLQELDKVLNQADLSVTSERMIRAKLTAELGEQGHMVLSNEATFILSLVL